MTQRRVPIALDFDKHAVPDMEQNTATAVTAAANALENTIGR
jgi:hypothetical protein